MALHIGRAIGRGIRRTLNPVGAVLTVLTFFYMLLFVGAVNTLVGLSLPAQVSRRAELGLTFPVPGIIAGAIMLLAMAIGIVVYLAAARGFTRRPRTRGTLSADLFTRRIGRAVLSALIANVIVSVAVIVGLILLVIPGIYLAVSFLFVVFAIAVEDAGAVESLRRSWDLAAGNRWRLFLLFVLIGAGTSLFASVGSVVSIVDATAGELISLAVSSILGIISFGILSDAYGQLRED